MKAFLKKIDRKITSFIYLKPHFLKMEKPVISFTFDDFPKSAVTNGAAILEEFGYTGTFYCIGTFNGTTQLGIPQYNNEDLEKLVTQGHEIGCHTYRHTNCQSTNIHTLLDEIDKNSKYLASRNIQNPVSFSYPYGKIGLINKAHLQNRFISARGISPGINSCITDLSQLKANRLYSNIHLSKSKSLIDKVEKNNGWLIFYTHDVDVNPGKFGCTPEYFREIVKYVSKKNLSVLPIKHALAARSFSK